MASPSFPSEVRDRLESVQENTALLRRQIKEPKANATVFSDKEFHSKLVTYCQQLSRECTKIAVLFSQPPPPSLLECGVICRQLEATMLHLTSALNRISPDEGKTLKLEAQSNVMNILSDVYNFVDLIIKGGYASKPSTLQGTGLVWESCEAIGKLSKDNKSAVTKVVLAQFHLLQDAWTELEQLEFRKGVEDEGMEGWEVEDKGVNGISSDIDKVSLEEVRGWCEADMETVHAATSVLQLTVDFTKKVCHQLLHSGSVYDVEKLDLVAEQVRQLSPLVDDLITELPAPIKTDEVLQLALRLGRYLVQFMDSCHFMYHGNSSHSNHARDIATTISKILELLKCRHVHSDGGIHKNEL